MSYDAQNDVWWDSPRTYSLSTNTRTLLTIHEETIPIVFVPGIMGTRLNGPKGATWNPNDELGMLQDHGSFLVSAKERQKLEEYVTGLRVGRIEGPKAEALMARAALGHVLRVAESASGR